MDKMLEALNAKDLQSLKDEETQFNARLIDVFKASSTSLHALTITA